MGIEYKLVHEEQGKSAYGQVEIKDPAPAVIVGDPSTQCGPENRRQKNADAEGRHGMPVPFLGESFQKNRLGQRLQSAARQALEHAKDDQLRKRSGQSATERC